MNSKNLFKLFTNIVPRCSECIYFKKINEINGNGNCKKFGDIVYARSRDKYCGIDAKYFKQNNKRMFYTEQQV